MFICNYRLWDASLYPLEGESLLELLPLPCGNISACVCARTHGSVSSLSVASRSILRALYLAHLQAFCSSDSTDSAEPLPHGRKRGDCFSRRSAVHRWWLVCAAGLTRLRWCRLMVKEANLWQQVRWFESQLRECWLAKWMRLLRCPSAHHLLPTARIEPLIESCGLLGSCHVLHYTGSIELCCRYDKTRATFRCM